MPVGPAGPQGEQGIPGPVGPQGEAGVTGSQVVESPRYTFGTSATPSTMLRSVDATCPAGTVVTGGGYDIQGRTGDVVVMTMKPQGQTYSVTAINNGT